MENKPKKLTLDYSIWHCGDNDKVNGLGKGGVALLNKEGYMCCLGQFCEQLGAPREMLMDRGEPGDIKFVCPSFNLDKGNGDFETVSTTLSSDLIGINDDKYTTPQYKLLKIEELLEEEGIQLEVINKPETK